MTEEKAVVSTKAGFSPVWILPIVALLLGVYAVYYSISQQGPEVEIHFKTASGLVAGKTKIKYLDVEVGLIESIHFSEDRESVIATAKLELEAEDLLREDTRFWVVTARLGAGAVSGLDTLLSGAYVQLAAGGGAPGTRSYTALDLPPVTPPGAPGMHLELVTRESPSLGPGNPVLYHGYKVGRVESMKFDPEEKILRYKLFIDAPFHKLVDSSVRFWNQSGVSVSLNADGLAISTGSLETILLGGVAFDTPPGVPSGNPVESGAEFKLYGSFKDIQENPYRYGLYFVAKFTDSLRGLKPGAPVEYRGLNIGRVERLMLREAVSLREAGTGQALPVLLYLEPARLSGQDTPEMVDVMRQGIEAGVKNGMRATLASGNLITGALYVEIDYYPDAPPEPMETFMEYDTIPTMSAGLRRIEHQVSTLLDKLNALPLDTTVTDANEALSELTGTLAAARKILEDDKTQALTSELQATLVDLRAVMAGFAPESEAYQSMNSSLLQLNQTLNNLNSITRTLSDQPNAVVMPVDLPPDPIPEANP
jgi:paraquat-inducible protein B